MNVLIPAAGLGSRFSEAGYTFPKPLIDVNGKSMLERVVDNIGLVGKARHIFIVQKEHYDAYNLDSFLKQVAPGSTIIQVKEVTDGAACTALLAKHYIDDGEPLVIANSDQLVEWVEPCFYDTLEAINFTKCDGAVFTFEGIHPKWSFARTASPESNVILEVAEKKPISNRASVGIYYWNKGKDFVRFAERMIEREIRSGAEGKEEYYICPVYNQAIEDGKIIIDWPVNNMIGLGTPEDLQLYLRNK